VSNVGNNTRVDKDIDNLISSRSRQLAAENEQHRLLEAWAQSERQFRAAQRSQNQREWILFWEARIDGALAAVARYEMELKRVKAAVPDGEGREILQEAYRRWKEQKDEQGGK
jgi:hypothetical protein